MACSIPHSQNCKVRKCSPAGSSVASIPAPVCTFPASVKAAATAATVMSAMSGAFPTAAAASALRSIFIYPQLGPIPILAAGSILQCIVHDNQPKVDAACCKLCMQHSSRVYTHLSIHNKVACWKSLVRVAGKNVCMQITNFIAADCCQCSAVKQKIS